MAAASSAAVLLETPIDGENEQAHFSGGRPSLSVLDIGFEKKLLPLHDLNHMGHALRCSSRFWCNLDIVSPWRTSRSYISWRLCESREAAFFEDVVLRLSFLDLRSGRFWATPSTLHRLLHPLCKRLGRAEDL
ncbi:hypothetical protein AK812_SmicGene35418 [Symbiodinium microadriaticum]|uniref:Uncharacterized protein n=1 Tax=Symbiodinium microadriaticum TaxID=2951 RepID=A0A1Q9CLH4_SYMMI|nr:hypothetical protein AK812_SmicGene35418 [Symbiodinium microadriaticum]